jgi:hypothetical protein
VKVNCFLSVAYGNDGSHLIGSGRSASASGTSKAIGGVNLAQALRPFHSRNVQGIVLCRTYDGSHFLYVNCCLAPFAAVCSTTGFKVPNANGIGSF